MPLDLSEVFLGLDITPQEVRTWMERPSTQHGICVCGHAEGAHTQNVTRYKSKAHDSYRDRGIHVCLPSRSVCPCPEYREVLQTEDVRLFKFKTTGPEEKHALSKGIEAARLKGHWVRWDPHLGCINSADCGNYLIMDKVNLVPVAYDSGYNEYMGPTDQNVMICEVCRHSVIMTWASDPSFVRAVRNEELWSGK